MRTLAYSKKNNFNVSNAEHKACRLYANWEQVYVSGHRWKCRLVVSLSEIFVASESAW